MKDQKKLWTQFTSDGSLPPPSSTVFGDRAAQVRLSNIYKVVYSYLQNSADRNLNYDDWSSIISSYPSAEKEMLTSPDCLKKLINFKPELVCFIKNIQPSAKAQINFIDSQRPITFQTIFQAKSELAQFNKQLWTRDQTFSEEQGGTSVLGHISEGLLEHALGALVDGEDVFSTNNKAIKTYGDFVVMSLPNNLWISVKSGNAKERLIVSGFFTDVVGIGFFTDPSEFISSSKVRNYKKVGFLAIYLPDGAVDKDQEDTGINTYDEVVRLYEDKYGYMPENLNRKPFFRKLTVFGKDIARLKERPIKTRTTIDF